ncbi:hypothetical protein [Streptomyces hokutonensis]|uniref:hypothetical protein n=1 Tax=Streptomyces hokutonensis TaxID=1306990 RepID=UPI00036112CF|nr:hypothetical protein [Streptomyces hokutonensis]
MSASPAEQAPTLTVGALPGPIDPSDLAVAIRVGQHMLARYGAVGLGDIHAYAEAHGGLTEALRILLRALDAEPDTSSPSSGGSGRCPAAHPEDPTPCTGPVAVTVLDAANAGAHGCEHHAARLLASLEGGRVYGLPDAPSGTAIRVFKAAGALRPFPWIADAPRVLPSQLSRDENRPGGEHR